MKVRIIACLTLGIVTDMAKNVVDLIKCAFSEFNSAAYGLRHNLIKVPQAI